MKKLVPSFLRKSGVTLLNCKQRPFMYLGNHTLNHSSTGVLSLFSRESCIVVQKRRTRMLRKIQTATNRSATAMPPINSAATKPDAQISAT